ncbi:MAG: phosphoribosyltransferase family protein [Burkholderiaceae bacterium]|nr:phosphoribosyltransferase family protein [Burkholderiaceae bacterium]
MLFRPFAGIPQRLAGLVAHLPSQCAVCHAWPAQRVCNACVARFAQPQARCQRCAMGVPEGVTVCGACLRAPPPVDTCLAAVDYGYPWSDALGDFKFHGDPGWAGTLATLLRSTPWVEPALEAADRVIPIPLSAQRLRERGFNQAALLAQHVARTKTDTQSLLRLRTTEAQSRLDRAQRLANLREAFAIEPAQLRGLCGLRVVLIDDVMTTGATLHAAAHALREAGVAHITGLVVARTALP